MKFSATKESFTEKHRENTELHREKNLSEPL